MELGDLEEAEEDTGEGDAADEGVEWDRDDLVRADILPR